MLKEYAVRYWGLIVKTDELNYTNIAKRYNKTNFNPEDIDSRQDLIDLICENVEFLVNGTDGARILPKNYCCDEVVGQPVLALDIQDECAVTLNEDDWVLMDLPKYPTLFKQAYKNQDELLSQLKDTYGEFIVDKNFDYERRLVILNGVWYL